MKIPRLIACLALAAVALATAATAQEHPTKKEPAQKALSATGQAAKSQVQASGGNLLAAAAADSRLGTFVTAVKAAGLQDQLSGDGPYTIFAPTDDAFAKLPAGTLESLLQPANRARLAGILANHVVPGQLGAADAKTMKATNIAGHDLDLHVADGHLTVDGAAVVGPELKAKNGVIHPIDTVLMPAPPQAAPQDQKPKDHPAH